MSPSEQLSPELIASLAALRQNKPLVEGLLAVLKYEVDLLKHKFIYQAGEDEVHGIRTTINFIEKIIMKDMLSDDGHSASQAAAAKTQIKPL
jgi:hypothetical protein